MEHHRRIAQADADPHVELPSQQDASVPVGEAAESDAPRTILGVGQGPVDPIGPLSVPRGVERRTPRVKVPRRQMGAFPVDDEQAPQSSTRPSPSSLATTTTTTATSPPSSSAAGARSKWFSLLPDDGACHQRSVQQPPRERQQPTATDPLSTADT